MKKIITVLMALAIMAHALPLRGARVKDITRLGGAQANMVSGIGIVVGLSGTGDKGKFLPMVRAYSQQMKVFGHYITSAQELDEVSSVALVKVIAELPPFHSKGDKVDVSIATLGPASSLEGGKLLISYLVGPNIKYDEDEPVRIVARGSITIGKTMTTGRVAKGGIIITPFESDEIIKDGTISFLLSESRADWETAETIANAIHTDYAGIQSEIAQEFGFESEKKAPERVAKAVSANRIQVRIPDEYKNNVPGWINRCQRIVVPDLLGEARVVIDETSGTVVATGNVEITPVIIAHKNLKITLRSLPLPGQITNVGVVPEPTPGSQLGQFVEALRRMNVTPQDLIEIFKKLDAAGVLNAKLVVK